MGFVGRPDQINNNEFPGLRSAFDCALEILGIGNGAAADRGYDVAWGYTLVVSVGADFHVDDGHTVGEFAAR